MWPVARSVCVVTVLISFSWNSAGAAVQQPRSVRGSAPRQERNNAQNRAARAKVAEQQLAEQVTLLASTSRPRSPIRGQRVQRVLDSYYVKPLNTRDDAPWSLLHWSIAYGVDAMVCVGDPSGKPVTAIGWLCSNYPAKGVRLIAMDGQGMSLPVAPGIQGHDGQFLSMLAQSRVNRDYLLRVGGREMNVADLVEHEKLTCRGDMELTFKLIGIAHYEGTACASKSRAARVGTSSGCSKSSCSSPSVASWRPAGERIGCLPSATRCSIATRRDCQ